MKVVQKINIELSVVEQLVIIEALDAFLNLDDIHELDRKDAEHLRKRIFKEAWKGAKEVNGKNEID